MTTTTPGPARTTERELWARVARMLRLSEEQTWLLTAIHEAGHIVVADTMGIPVCGVAITADDGVYSGSTHLDTGDRPMTLAEELVIRAAGFQATYFWMSRPRPGVLDATVLNDGLLIPAAHDFNACDAAWRAAGHAEQGMQEGIEPAARILKARWSTVIRIAYNLARAETLPGQTRAAAALIRAELLACLTDESRLGGRRAVKAYHRWATEFADRVSLSDGAGL